MANGPERDERPEWDKLEGWDRTFAQMWEFCFGPEIEPRRAAGALGDGFSLYMAQALFPPERDSRVLLNDEVQGECLMRATRHLVKREPVQLQDLQHVERFELPDDLLDNGHFTIIRAGEGWSMFSNFLSGRAKAKDMLELAGQFWEAARTSAQKDHAGPAVDNLFSASELFNKLHQQRPSARYGNKQNRPPLPDEDSFDLVSVMIERGLARVRKATDREPATDEPAATGAIRRRRLCFKPGGRSAGPG